MCLYARDLTPEEGRRVQHEIRHGKDPTYMKRCQVVLCSAQGMTVQEIAKLTLLSEYHIRELIRTFNEKGLDSMRPRKPGKPHYKFTEEEKASVAEFAQIPPRVLGYPFNSWSLSKLKIAIEERNILGDGKKKTISDEAIRLILEEYGISYQRTKTWKESNDPKFDIKKADSGAEEEGKGFSEEPRRPQLLAR
jgi:transposase